MFAFRIARRLFAKLLGIAGFLLALVGGALIGYSALTSGELSPISLFVRLLEALLGLGAIIAGVIIYTGPHAVWRIHRRDRGDHSAPHNQLRNTSDTGLRGRSNRIDRTGDQTGLVEVLETITSST